MKPIAIAFSDLHAHNWKQRDKDGSRLDYTLETLDAIAYQAWRAKVPLLFMGDWIHTPEYVDNEVNSELLRMYRTSIDMQKLRMYGISGNHDQKRRNLIDKPSPSHLNALEVAFDSFNLMDNKSHNHESMILQGIPYYPSQIDLKYQIELMRNSVKRFDKFKILMLHSDMPGAKTPIGFELGETDIPRDLDDYFKDWDLVLCGHIHRPMKLSNRVYMMGATNHQDEGDVGCEMGYWKIYREKPPKFCPLDIAPKFIKLNKGESAKDDFNYYIEYTPDAPVADIADNKGSFNINRSREKLAKKYAKVLGVKDESKINALIKILHETD